MMFEAADNLGQELTGREEARRKVLFGLRSRKERGRMRVDRLRFQGPLQFRRGLRSFLGAALPLVDHGMHLAANA